MYTKDQIWGSISKELAIIKHLAEKIPEGQEHHKPTEKQRTTLELLQYLSIVGAGTLAVAITGDSAAFAQYVDRSKDVTVHNFPEAIDWEKAEMKKLFDQFTDENLAEEISVWGSTMPRNMLILDCIKMMAGYKMQLFLYAKASGNHAIGTPNLWAGMDMPAPAASGSDSSAE